MSEEIRSLVLHDVGTLWVEIPVRRTWRQRLLSLPWRPWVKWTTVSKPLGTTGGGLLFTLPKAPR